MSSQSCQHRHVGYCDPAEQLNLFLTYGPMGVKVVDDRLVQSASIRDSFNNYTSLFLSIITRKEDQRLAEVVNLLSKQVESLNKVYPDIFRPRTECHKYLLHTCSTIAIWNKNHGLTTGVTGFLHSCLLKAAATDKMAQQINKFYIHFSMNATPLTDHLLPKKYFSCSFENAEQLPLIIAPNPTLSREHRLDALHYYRHKISLLLKEYGAVKLRGWDIKGAAQFESTVETIFNCKSEGYIGGDGSRDKIPEGKQVHTSTKAKPEYSIVPHNERSILPAPAKMPDIIAFYGEKSPRFGTGQTILCRTEGITEDLEEENLLFEGKEIKFKERFPSARHPIALIDKTYKTWQQLYGIKNYSSQEEIQTVERAQAQPAPKGYSFNWEGNWFKWHVRNCTIPATRAHPFKPEKQLWMNQLHISKLTRGLVSSSWFEYIAAKAIYSIVPWRYQALIDGKPLSDAQITKILDILKKNTTRCDWRDHDILIVDNKLVAHGRDPSDSKDKRMIYTILCSFNSQNEEEKID